jgi:predicted dehydrogenase
MENFMKKRIGFVGSGRIAEFHIKASIAAGFEVSVICSRPGSQSLDKIRNKFPNIETVVVLEEILNYDLDAISIITSTDSLLNVYQKVLLKTDCAILIEKPVCLNSIDLQSSQIDLFREKTIVGYNRRFYSSVQDLKNIIELNPDLLQSHWNIPEVSWEINPSQMDRELFIKDNSVHMLDLLLFLNGTVGNMVVKEIKSQNLSYCRSGIIEFENGRVTTFSLSFGVPDNTHVSYYAPGMNLLLKPIEILHKFEDMEMLLASNENPVKKYIPKEREIWIMSEADRKYKPGFLLQYRELMNLCSNKPRVHSANLYDALMAQKLAERIINANEH